MSDDCDDPLGFVLRRPHADLQGRPKNVDAAVKAKRERSLCPAVVQEVYALKVIEVV